MRYSLRTPDRSGISACTEGTQNASQGKIITVWGREWGRKRARHCGFLIPCQNNVTSSVFESNTLPHPSHTQKTKQTTPPKKPAPKPITHSEVILQRKSKGKKRQSNKVACLSFLFSIASWGVLFCFAGECV